MTSATKALTADRVELSTGATLEYVEQGNRDGVPAIFLHGFTDSWHSFELLLPQLPPSIHALALTQRGHGDSGRPESGYEPEDFAADVAAFLDAKGITKAVIIGHSMGSFVAQRFAMDFPEKVSAVVLIGSFANFVDNEAVQGFWEEGVKTLEDPIDPAMVREFQEGTFARPVPPPFVETVIGESLKVPSHVWRAALGGLVDKNHTPELASIKAPTLVIWGDQDAFCPRGDQEILSSGIAGSELLVYEGTGHTPQWEEPQRLSRDIVNFVNKIGA